MTDAEIDQYAHNWVSWCVTRRFYIKPGSQNVLARFMPSKGREPPNARLDAFMQWFNTAIHALGDMPQHENDIKAFLLFYVDHKAPVKKELEEMKMSRATFYRRAREAARRAHSLALSLQKAHEDAELEKANSGSIRNLDTARHCPTCK